MFPPGAGHLLPRCVLSYRSISRVRHIDWFVALPGMIYLAARRLLQCGRVSIEEPTGTWDGLGRDPLLRLEGCKNSDFDTSLST